MRVLSGEGEASSLSGQPTLGEGAGSRDQGQGGGGILGDNG